MPVPALELAAVVSCVPPVVAAAEGVVVDSPVAPWDFHAWLEIVPVSSGPCRLSSELAFRYIVGRALLDELLVVASDVESSVVAGSVAWTGSRL